MFNIPAFGICNNAATARNADRFNSSCFSYSCFTELGFTFNVHVERKGSTNCSNPINSQFKLFKIQLDNKETATKYQYDNNVTHVIPSLYNFEMRYYSIYFNKILTL